MSFPGVQVVRANDINDNNRVVGLWTPDNGVTRRGFIATAYQNVFQDLGLLQGFPGAGAVAISNDGVMVGSAITNTAVRALIWNPGDIHPTDLNTLVEIPGETLVEAMDINNAGQILARGFNGYYIFTPIPEPVVASTMAIGLALLRPRGGTRSVVRN